VDVAPTVSVLALGATPGWKTHRLLVGWSLVPGFVFGFVLVAITGLFIGPMFGLAARRLAAERNALVSYLQATANASSAATIASPIPASLLE
jgi:hypothetical protein